jgi:hypothetical protein
LLSIDKETPPPDWRRLWYGRLGLLREAEQDNDRKGNLSLLMGDIHGMGSFEEFQTRFKEVISDAEGG